MQAARLRSAGAGLGFALLAPHGALAAEWSLEPNAQVSMLGETNPRLMAGGSEDAQAVSAGADLSLRRATELSTLALSASASQRQYRQASALDRLDTNAALLFQARRERFDWQARATATRDTTLTSELGLSGLSENKRRHESAGASLSLNWSATERLGASVGTDVQFDMYPGEDASLVDYRYRSAHLGGSYILGPRSALSLTAQRGELAVSGSNYESTDSALTLQYRFQPSERTSLSIAGGPSRVKGLFSTEDGETFNASLSRSGEYFTATLSGGRRIAPTGRGYLTQRDEASLDLSTNLTERLRSSLSGTYIRSKDVLAGFGFSLSEVRYRRISASLGWQFRQRWSLTVGGGYADQASRGPAAPAGGYDLRAGFNWNGSRHVW